MPPADYIFGPLLNAAGNPLPIDHVKLITLLIATYPLAIFYRSLFFPPAHKTLTAASIPKNANELYSQHLFSIAFALIVFTVFFDLGKGLAQLLLSSLGTYLIASYGLGGKNMPWVAFVFVMGHMTINHLYRQINETSLDVYEITGAQMVLCMKLTAFAWNVHDGRQKSDGLSGSQQYRMIKQMPGVIPFLGYCFFFPSVLVGPSFDYVEYDNFVTLRMFKEHTHGGDEKDAKIRVPRPGNTARLILLQGLVFLGLFGAFGAAFPPEAAAGKHFDYRGFWYAFWFLNLASTTARFKYYGVWNLADAACVAAGLGFQGHSSEGGYRWDRVKNIDVWKYETAQNHKVLLDHWNMNTNKWLRNYIYFRVAKPGKKPGFKSSMATFAVSALWHGLYPGYYLTFITAGFEQTLARLFRRDVRPFVLKSDLKTPTKLKPAYDIFSWFITQTSINYTVLPFLLLRVDTSLKVWSRVYFFVHIATFGGLAIFYAGGAKFLRKTLKDRESRAGKHKEYLKKEDNFATNNARGELKGVPSVPPQELE